MVEAPSGSHGLTYPGDFVVVESSGGGGDLFRLEVRDGGIGGKAVGGVLVRDLPFYAFTEPVPEPDQHEDWGVAVKVDDQPGRTF